MVTTSERAVIDSFLATHRHELIAFRRRLHAHPELSSKEFGTTEAIVDRLLVAGLNPAILPSGTGATCDVGSQVPSEATTGNSAEPMIALRADLDALAMDDLSTSTYVSTVAGVAHACGHDVHTTVVLGAGLLLARLLSRREAPAGRVRLIFEPSEETVPGGAVEVAALGLLTGVGAIIALHCDPKLDTGRLGVRSGPITSAVDVVEIDIFGPGGHTARPERTVDLVDVVGRIVLNVPDLLAGADPAHPPRLVFGSVHAGDAPNVIPAHARLIGTLRSRDRQSWLAAPGLLESALQRVIAPTGATWSMTHKPGVPPVVNDSFTTSVLAEAADAMLGEGAVLETGHSWGGDTFAWYTEKAPGCYARLGTHDPANVGPRLDLHSSAFDVDERAIEVGIRVLVAASLSFLRRSSEPAGADTASSGG
ncbi:MAG: amidohydrolase [Actinomycetes bacterium]